MEAETIHKIFSQVTGHKSSIVYGFFPESCTLSVSTLDCEPMFSVYLPS